MDATNLIYPADRPEKVLMRINNGRIYTIQTAGILTPFIWHILARDQRVHITTLKGYDAEYPSVDHLSCFKGTF
uniref:Uncharacterized protein n=1 Tax=Acrobeloides nanus TaxID=290746 RepID=A0A914DQR7_9BILA